MKTRAMAEIAGFKTRISKACSPITALRSRVQALDQPFSFPNTAIECTVFIAEKGAELEELKLTVTELLRHLKEQIQNAMNFTAAKKDQSEREKKS